MKLFSTFAIASIAALSTLAPSANAGLVVRAVSATHASDACASYDTVLKGELGSVILQVENTVQTNGARRELSTTDRRLQSSWCVQNCQGFPHGQCHVYAFPWCAPLRRNLAEAAPDAAVVTKEEQGHRELGECKELCQDGVHPGTCFLGYPLCEPNNGGPHSGAGVTTVADEDALLIKDQSTTCAAAVITMQAKMNVLANTIIADQACKDALLDTSKQWKCFRTD